MRDTDVRWTEDGVPQHERGHLDDAGLQIHRDAWRLATDPIVHWAHGRVAIETDWIELPGVTLRGLRIAHYAWIAASVRDWRAARFLAD